jgi:hypothetical protein
MRFAYADPPYPGMSHFYKDHRDYGGEVDHAELIDDLMGYDGWALHTASTTLKQVLAVCPDEVRIGSWVKPFAIWKRNVPVAYAWEPVIFWGGRRRAPELPTVVDFISEPITLRRGLTGAKPDAVCRWVFEVLGMSADDELHDLYPGSGAVSAAWEAWKDAPALGRLDFARYGTETHEQPELGDAA